MNISAENKALFTVGTTAAMLRRGYPAFLTEAEIDQLVRIRESRLLMNGEHEQFYLTEGRTKFAFPPERMTDGTVRSFYLTYNLAGLCVLKAADLLFAQAPQFDCSRGRGGQWEALQALVKRTQFQGRLLDAAANGGAEGESYFEVLIHRDGKVYIRTLDAAEIFPVGEVEPDGQHRAYVRYQIRNVGPDSRPIWLLLETTAEAGRITRACWQLGDRKQKARRLDLDQWDAALRGLDTVATGIDANTVIWVPNLLGKAVSDFACCPTQIDTINAKNTQIARVISKHSSPRLAAPRALADAQGNLPAMAEVFFYDQADQLPQYITWDASLAAAVTDRAAAVNQLLVRMEMSPALLGLKEGAAPDAWKKLRLEASNALAKAGRRAIIWTPAVARILETALALELTIPGKRGSFAVEPVGVNLRDGLPIDEAEQAATAATWRSAGLMSRWDGVMMRVQDQEATEAEVAEIEREAAGQVPSVMIGEGEETTDEEPGARSQAPEAPPSEATGQEIQVTQETVLNGAQIQAAVDIVGAVARGEMPADAALGQIQIFFNLSAEQAGQILGSAEAWGEAKRQSSTTETTKSTETEGQG